MSFVEISKEEMERTLSLFNATDYTPPYGTTEYVYRIEIKPFVIIVVYSSVSTLTDWARGIGKDAIRLVLLYEMKKAEHHYVDVTFPIGKETKTYRSAGWEERLVEKIKQLKEQGEKVKICPKDSGVMKKKTGPYGDFWGCSFYPDCHYTERYVEVKTA